VCSSGKLLAMEIGTLRWLASSLFLLYILFLCREGKICET
jgi:hypothetical protein